MRNTFRGYKVYREVGDICWTVICKYYIGIHDDPPSEGKTGTRSERLLLHLLDHLGEVVTLETVCEVSGSPHPLGVVYDLKRRMKKSQVYQFARTGIGDQIKLVEIPE